MLALSLALVGNAVMAQEVSVDVAKSRALEFLSSQSVSAKRAKGNFAARDLSLVYTSVSEEKTCYYVFNAGNDEGFVIVGGDEVAREILGYCDHGSFDYATAPENFKWWLSQYTEQIARAEASDAAQTPNRAKARTASYATIEPLIHTQWNQYAPYWNKIIPDGQTSTKGYVTGCVATAMSQVMKFYEYPTTGTGSHSYTSETSQETFSANFGNTTYDWGNMLDDYSSGYSDTQANAVATLMFHAGVSVDMDYGKDGSGASNSAIAPALVNYFDYDKSIRNEKREYYSDEEWEDLVYEELSEGRPIIYAGSALQSNGSLVGHAFICDGYGYDDNNNLGFHINWGWGGYYDGFFPLSGTRALCPKGTGAGGANAGDAYDQGQTIVINIKKDAGGVENAHLAHTYESRVLYLKVGDTQYTDESYDYTKSSSDNNSYYLYSTLWNISVFEDTKYIDFGVKAVGTETGATYYWQSASNVELGLTSYYPYYPLVFTPSDIVYNGTYELRPICRRHGLGDDYWTEVDIYNGTTIPTITVTGATEPEHASISFTVASNEVQVNRTLQIEHDSNYKGEVTYTSSNTGVAEVDANGLITGKSVGTATIQAAGSSYGFFDATTTDFTITVTEFVKDNITFEISGTSVIVGGTLTISQSSDYKGNVSYSSSNTAVASVDNNGTVTGIGVGSATITVTAEGNDYYNAMTQTFDVTVYDISLWGPCYFNNDNNPYPEDLRLYIPFIVTSSSGTGTCVIYYKIKNDNGTEIDSNNINFGSVPSNAYYTGYVDFTWFPQNLTANSVYTFYFYKDEDYTVPFSENATLSFTYRNTLTVEQYRVCPAGYGTLILPFNATCPSGMTVYSCSEMNNSTLVLTEESSIARNIPYIVVANPEESYSFTGPDAVEMDYGTKGYMRGALTNNVALESNVDYILQYDETANKAAFYRYDGASAGSGSGNDNNSEGTRLCAKNRAFLHLDSAKQNARFALPNQGEETEGIENITLDRDIPMGIYSIDGERRSTLLKGMNVIILEDGSAQKVYVK